MPQARGSQSAIVLYDETVFGQAPGTPLGTKLYVVSCGIKAAQALADSETLTSVRARGRPTRNNIDVAGPLPIEIHPESIGQILRHTLGQNVTTGTDPYTHTMTIGALPVGMTIEKDHGGNIAGAGRYERFFGCRVGSASFSFPQNGYPRAEFNIRGADHLLESSVLDATPDDYGCSPFSAFEASVEEGGDTLAVATEISFTIDNGLDENGYAIGGAGKRRNMAEGFATISGSLTAMFEDATLINKAINGTESSLKITLSRGNGLGSAGNESLEFFLQQLQYERTSPEITGPGGVLVQLGFRNYRVVGNTGLRVILKNAVPSLGDDSSS